MSEEEEQEYWILDAKGDPIFVEKFPCGFNLKRRETSEDSTPKRTGS